MNLYMLYIVYGYLRVKEIRTQHQHTSQSLQKKKETWD
jgi:hypothetical protein